MVKAPAITLPMDERINAAWPLKRLRKQVAPATPPPVVRGCGAFHNDTVMTPQPPSWPGERTMAFCPAPEPPDPGRVRSRSAVTVPLKVLSLRIACQNLFIWLNWRCRNPLGRPTSRISVHRQRPSNHKLLMKGRHSHPANRPHPPAVCGCGPCTGSTHWLWWC
jgi:hypothetical protein